MAIKYTNSQGVQIYVIPTTEDVSDCTKVATAVAAGSLVGCPQSLGAMEETRAVTEYKCLSSNETAKALGAISRGSLSIGLLLDPADATGQKALADAFAANENVIIAIELADAVTPTTGNGTTYVFTAGVSAVSIGIEMDAAIKYDVTLEIASSITMCPAT